MCFMDLPLDLVIIKMKKIVSSLLIALFSSTSNAECHGMEIHAHRGSHAAPENSLLAVTSALTGDWDAAEIDIQMLSDGAWVLNHDWELGRTTSLANRKVNRLDSTIWQEVYLKDRKGQLTNEHGAFLEQVLETTTNNPEKVLNIEIKQPFNGCKPIHDLVENMDKKWSNLKWFFTSVDTRNLQCVRQIDKNVYLGVIMLDPNAIMQTKFGRRFRSGYGPESINNQKLTAIKEALQAPVGVHVDVNALIKTPSALNDAKNLQMPVYTYTLEENTDKEHIKQLKKLIKKTNMLPTGAIINQKAEAFCSSTFN